MMIIAKISEPFSIYIDCNLPEVQAIGIGIRVAGKDYNSVHGVVVGQNLTLAYQNFRMFVRSRPWTPVPLA
jgi:hypothetical protein